MDGSDAVRDLYDSDFFAWTQTQARLLREGRTSSLDLLHLAEEVEAMGDGLREKMYAQLRRLTMHLLKHAYQPERRGNSWAYSIRDARRTLRRLLDKKRSLNAHFDGELADAYADAREDEAFETKLPTETFPVRCPWTKNQLLDLDHWPEAEAERPSGA